MAAINTLTGDFANAAWSNGTLFVPHTADTTRLDMGIDATIGYTDTTANWDLTGSSISWKNHWMPPHNLNGATQSQLSFELRDNGAGSTGYRLIRTNAGVWSVLKAAVQFGSTWTDINARLNPYMRFREASGTTYFEYSPDGTTWAQPTSNQSTANYATGGGITNLDVRFQPSATADSGRWAIQQLNGTAAPSITNDPTIFFVNATSTAVTAAVTPLAPAVPTGLLTGMLSILCVQGKGATAGVAPTITTPSGWTLVGTVTNNGTLVAATDQGSNTIGIYIRTDTYSGPSITTTGFNSASASIVVLRSSKSGATWDVAQTTTGSDTSFGLNMSVTAAGGIDVAAGDLVLVNFGGGGDAGAPNTINIGGMSGATQEREEVLINRAVTTGLDSRHIVAFVPIVSGSSSAAPTLTYTNSASTTGHARFIRIRDVAAAQSAFAGWGVPAA